MNPVYRSQNHLDEIAQWTYEARRLGQKLDYLEATVVEYEAVIDETDQPAAWKAQMKQKDKVVIRGVEIRKV